MKKQFLKLFLFCIFAAAIGTAIISCKDKVRDEDIQLAAETVLKANPDLRGVTVTVKNGVASLDGEVKDAATKATAESALKDVKGLKSIANNITVTPAPVPGPPVFTPPMDSADHELKKDVADAIKDNTGVIAEVKDSVITLTGHIKRTDLPKLMAKLLALKPKKVENKLIVK